MVINRRIVLKAIVTQQFKDALTREIQESLQQLDAEIGFLEQRVKKTITELTIKASPQAQLLKEQFAWEKRKREESKAGLLEQIKKVNTLELGTEVVQGELTGPVEIKIGDKWDDLNSKEIVIKDGIVIAIR